MSKFFITTSKNLPDNAHHMSGYQEKKLHIMCPCSSYALGGIK